MNIPATVYLIHFERPYKHAKHYVGYTALETIEERMARHREGRGARLLQVVTEAGINWVIARLWTFPTVGKAKQKEKRLKMRAATRHCPLCNGGRP